MENLDIKLLLRISLGLILCAFGMSAQAEAQSERQHEISGVVTDAGSGQMMPGVNVLVKGTSTGTSTGADGRFELTVSSLQDTLIFSFIGYKSKEIPIGGRSEIEIALQPEAIAGEELVVVGYSQKQRGEITGAVTDIQGESILETSESNMTQALQGKMAGVIVNDRGGEPGSNNARFSIRGQATLGDNAPLIVIDGVPRSQNSFANLSPNDIESVSVLKDAAAAIYGARAANGVILITTKRGRVGQPMIQVNSSYGVQTITKYPEAMNAYQRATYFNEFYRYNSQQPLFTEEEIEHFRRGDRPLAYPDTDWAGIVLSDYAPQTHHNVSASGGTESIQYYLSGDYRYKGGLFKSNSLDYNQFQIRANITSQVTDDLNIGLDLLGRQGKKHAPYSGSGVWQGMLYHYPWIKARWSDGRLGPGMDTGNSALTDSDDEYGWVNNNSYDFNSKFSFEYDMSWLTSNLQLSGYASFDYTKLDEETFQDIWTAYDYNPTTETYSPVQGHAYNTLYSRVLTEGSMFGNTQFYHLQLNYDKAFGDHELSAFVAYEQSESTLDTLSAYRRGLPSDQKVQLFAGSEIAKDNFGSTSLDGRVNYFGSLSYNYASRYMADFSLRYDGSFNFPRSSRFGLFPAVSVGWNITNEAFMQGTNHWLDNLKLRLSWGKMGNDRVPAYQYLNQYQLGGSLENYYAFGVNPQAQKGFVSLNTANPNITWEKSYKSDIGIDLSAWNGLLSMTIDWFYEKRRDILTSRSASVPDYTAISLPDENIGKVDNRGIELTLNHENNIGNVAYHLGGNMTYHNNKIIFMDEAKDVPEHQQQEGHPLDSWLVYKSAGLFQSRQEIDNSPHLPGTQPGDIKYVDITGDGQITGEDMIRKYSSPIPKMIFSFNAGVTYKNVALNLFFQGQAKAEQLTFNDEGLHLIQPFFEKRWTPENRNAGFPRAFDRDDVINVRPSTFWLYDASFLRLKNIQIAYSVPSQWLSKVGISGMKVYLNGRNLITWDHMLGNWDPERRNEGNAYNYPQIKTFVLGTNITF